MVVVPLFASIASLALELNACAVTLKAPFNSPFAKILILSDLRTNFKVLYVSKLKSLMLFFSGYKSKRGFEGGQMPLQRRLTKRGFKNNNRVEFRTLNLAELSELAEKNNIKDFNFETNIKIIKLKLIN